jgi:hypothetical protein
MEPVPAPEFRVAGRDEDAPTQQISLAAVGDRCVNCGAVLSSDQRYCVNCGERRGKARFTVAQAAAETAPSASAPPRAPRRPRVSSGFTLIAGIATLLIAMGVGVLIGHNSAGVTRTPTQNITVAGGGAAAPTATSATTASGGATATKSHSGGKSGQKKSKAASKSKPSAAVSQKAAAAASKVTGGSAKVAAPTVTAGGACSAGTAGCQGGKLTGNFFGN